jgi:Tol biopolymer transport system component
MVQHAALAGLVLLALAWSAPSPSAQVRQQAQRFQQAVDLMSTKGDCRGAIRLFEDVAKGPDRSLSARALLHTGQCHEKLGQEQAQKTYERLLEQFSDQREVAAEARARLAALLRASRPASSEMIARRLSAAPAVSMGSALSPDARHVTFVDWETGDLAVLDVASGQTRRLTNNKSWFTADGFAGGSTWSPRGDEVAYAWTRNDDVNELRVVGLDGSEARTVYRSEEVLSLSAADWSADGREILILSRRRDLASQYQMALISASTGAVRVLKSFARWSPGRASLSPDGRYVVYDLPGREDSPDRDVFLLATDGSLDVALVDHPADDVRPIWAADGHRVLFLSDRTGAMGAWVIEVINGRTGTGPELVKHDMGNSSPTRFAREGSLYYCVSTSFQDVFVARLDPTSGMVIGTPVPSDRRLIGANRWPEWSPDGRYLAYVSTRTDRVAEGPATVVIQPLGAGEPRELVPRLGYFSRLRWSPDGTSILVNGRDTEGRGGLYRIDVATGNVVALVSSTGGQSFPRETAWAPDGRSIFYWYVDEPVMSLDLRTGLTRAVSSSRFGALSPDGRWLATIVADPNTQTTVLQIEALDGSDRRELLREPGPEAFSQDLVWMPDGRHLLFPRVPASRNARTELWRVAIAGGSPEPLGLAIEALGQVRIHPDGQRIAFTAGGYRAELWVIENLLPPAKNAASR